MNVQVETLPSDALAVKILIMEHMCRAGQRRVADLEKQLAEARLGLKRNEAVLADLREAYLRRAV